MPLRFTPTAAAALRAAIAEAGGVEVFAVGDVDPYGRVKAIEVHARGTGDSVIALLRRPRAGQVVIHNHPSGVIEPSEPDLTLAGRFGDEGVGVVIVDNPVTRDRWVVEPAARRLVPVDLARVRAFFEQDLPRAFGGQHEPRAAQVEMALAVAEALNGGEVLLVEAGTGTGKSLAYLVPATLWALANDSKVAVSTFTRTLQAQLVGTDLPLMRRAGLEFSAALLKGRGNYLCRRKLEAAVREGGLDAELWQRLDAWAEVSAEGSLQDLGEDLAPDLWERVESDSDQTLRARCAHYNRCFYYEARRRAAASHLLVVNHALLLADLHIKAQSDGDGVIPRYERVILDEAHHLEDAATSATAQVSSALSLRRLLAPLLSRRARPGALARIRETWADRHPALVQRSQQAESLVDELRSAADASFEVVGSQLLREDPKRRLSAADAQDPAWTQSRALLDELGEQIAAAQAALGALNLCMDEVEVPAEQMQPLLDLRRAERRLGDSLAVLRGFQEENPALCRWVERTEGQQQVRLCRAPIEVGGLLQKTLYDAMDSVVMTSATLAVGGRFEHVLGRLGLEERARTAAWGSPFSYRDQATLALPRDLPRPDDDGFLPAAADLVVELVRLSGGGAFVLCTSYAQVRAFGERLERELGDQLPVLIQGRAGRERLLERFRQTERSVLVGTDSFWEGVSVRGEALRLVIIPRLPFRVPTEPVAAARYEALARRGLDPFRAWALPEAVLKLRQGFGRLIRSRGDRGAVVILDRRVHDMWYGRLFLGSLPDARRLTGPTRAVLEQLATVVSPRGPVLQ